MRALLADLTVSSEQLELADLRDATSPVPPSDGGARADLTAGALLLRAA
jgi:hypothetical protein